MPVDAEQTRAGGVVLPEAVRSPWYSLSRRMLLAFAIIAFTVFLVYVDRDAVSEEIAFSRKLCARNNWPLIDVTRRSIEETAAAVMTLLADRRRQVAS